MKIEFNEYVDISEVLKFNEGIKPAYGKGTMKGVAWCECGKCVGNLLFFRGKIVGFLETYCSRCGKQINYSEADKYI